MNFRVTWEIDIIAETPEAAAAQAFTHMQRPGTTATVFDVASEAGDVERVDLMEREEESRCRSDDCDGDPANGEGYNGYCGTCADRLDAE